MGAKNRLVDELRTHALVIGQVTLTSGRTAEYYVDAKRAVLLPAGFRALGELVAEKALAAGADVKAFFVRKEGKQHGLQRRIEGPLLEPGDRCLIVEDVVTTGGSTLQAIEAVREAGHEIVGVTAILDRLAGGGDAIREAAAAPYEPLTTIDDIYPDRPQ
jgi:orotate phosphoribosyltransferase